MVSRSKPIARDKEGEGDALMDLISNKMLRMDYEYKQSASGCLGEVRRLGFHATQPVEIGCTTPTGKTTAQGGATRTKSVLTQHGQTVPPDTQIGNPQSGDKGTSALSKRRRPQATQSPTADAVGSGQSKRARAFVSCEAGERLSMASNRRQGPERSFNSDHGGPFTTDVASLVQEIEPIPQVAPESFRKYARPLLGRSSALAATRNLMETEQPSLNRNLHNNIKTMLTGNMDGQNEGETKVYHP